MNFKIFGLLAVSVTALMAFTATAYATTLTSPTGTVATGPSESLSEGHAELENPIANILCNSKLTGEVEKHGEGVASSGAVSTLTFSPCTNSWHVTSASGGTLSATYTSSYAATLVSNGATIETTRLGFACRYATSETIIGVATGGSNPTLHINAEIPLHGGSGLCGTGKFHWSGSYKGEIPLFYDP